MQHDIERELSYWDILGCTACTGMVNVLLDVLGTMYFEMYWDLGFSGS